MPNRQAAWRPNNAHPPWDEPPQMLRAWHWRVILCTPICNANTRRNRFWWFGTTVESAKSHSTKTYWGAALRNCFHSRCLNNTGSTAAQRIILPLTRRHQHECPSAAKQLDDRARAPKSEPTPSNHKQQLPTRYHQPDNIIKNAPRPPSSLTTELSPKPSPPPAITTATANTMPQTRRHHFNAPRPPSSLTTELSPQPEPKPIKH